MEQTATQSNSDNTMDCSTSMEDFLSTGRTGRRNAMPDILDEQKAAVGTGSLQFDMEKLNCSDDSKTVKPPQNAATNTQPGQGS